MRVYLNLVTKTNYSITPFFAQLKLRELFFQKEKNEVVNTSITDYLIKYGNTIDIASFAEKIKATQTEKIYLLWCNGKFCIDKLSDEEMSGMTFHSIKNGLSNGVYTVKATLGKNITTKKVVTCNGTN